MSLTFRDQVLVSLVSGGRSHDIYPSVLVRRAQEVANEACKAWGHEVAFSTERVLDGATLVVCRRCGGKGIEVPK